MFERRRKIGVAGVAAAAATALLAAGCGSSGNNNNTNTSSGTSVKGAVATLANINGAGANCIFPFETTQCYSVTNYEDFMYLMVRPLYMFGGNSNTSISADYADSPAAAPVYTDGGKTVQINLKGWKWSNGETVNAKDLMFDLNMLEGEKANYAGYTPGLAPDNIVSYSATGPNQVTLHLKKGYSALWFTYNQLAILTPMPMAWDVSAAGAAAGSGGCTSDSAADGWAKCKKVWKFLDSQNKDTSTYATNPLWQVIDGPYKLTSYNVNGSYNFVPNTKYSGKKAQVGVKFANYTSDTAIYTGLRTGALTIGGIPSTDLGKAQSNFLPAVNPLQAQGYTLQPAYSFGIGYAYINFNNPTIGPAFKQLYFRQAMMMLNNQAGMAASVGRGYAYPTTNGVPPQPHSQWVTGSMTENSGQGPYPYNPAKAQQLLAQHGWKKQGGVLTCTSSACGPGVKVGTQAKMTMSYTSGISTQEDQVNILKSGLAQAGIQLSPKGETFDSLLGDTVPCKATQASCKWDLLYLGGWLYNGPGFEPTGEALYQCGVPNNSGSYCDPKMDQLINATQTNSSLSTFAAYANYNAQQVPALWLPWQTSVVAVDKNIHNVTQNPLLMFTPEYWTCSTKTC